MSNTRKLDDIINKGQPSELTDILKEVLVGPGRKVVLLEGASGSGKSTLSVHLCMQWAEGNMFQEYQFVILVLLRDPTIRNATCFADLLQTETSMSHQVATEMLANNCHNVMFILDGWDELSSELRAKSIFRQLIEPTHEQCHYTHEGTIIVTSRPISSTDLQRVVSARVEVLGFSPTQLTEYFKEALGGDMEAVHNLNERIKEDPAVESTCCLPLNASILVHLYQCGNYMLPSTQYAIFSKLVLNCIFRHFRQRTNQRIESLSSIDQDDLPDAVRTPFNNICRLAYEGMKNEVYSFSSESLPANFDTLGLLQGTASFISCGESVAYNFLHVGIQEILAAQYMAKGLSDSEQATTFKRFFHADSRFSPVFRFYAAETKLVNSDIKNTL